MRNGFALMGMGLSVALGFAASASALSVDASGKVLNGWNVTPFVDGPAGTVGFNGSTKFFFQNNYSPISYPSGVGHQPSPGGATGEKFDLEEMHVRQEGSVVKFLLVASSGFTAVSSGHTYRLGDLLLDLNGDNAYDAGIVTHADNTGLVAGGLYEDIATARLQNLPLSYRGTPTEVLAGPWAVAAGSMVDQVTLETAIHSYAGEANTWLYEYAFDFTALTGNDPTQLNFHIAWGCGNDVINGSFELEPVPTDTPNTPGVPEPLTAGLTGMGLLALASQFGRRRKA